jgi:hypothetical protein
MFWKSRGHPLDPGRGAASAKGGQALCTPSVRRSGVSRDGVVEDGGQDARPTIQTLPLFFARLSRALSASCGWRTIGLNHPHKP